MTFNNHTIAHRFNSIAKIEKAILDILPEDDSDVLSMDISTSERIRRYDHLKGINSYISHIAGLLSESGRKIK